MSVQEVILVNEQDESIGAIEKMEAHQRGLLHRAFSVFIFNKQGEMLLQKRNDDKYHSAGLWTNACCSHPRPGESTSDAASRRLKEEMGFKTPLKKAFSFTYKTNFDNGLTEHEYDHVFTGEYNGVVIPNKNEVSSYCFMELKKVRTDIVFRPAEYTSWFKIAFPMLEDYLALNNFGA